ncbi:TrmB family transcriptional regulator [Halosimplex halophilum]|uniref:TrmB family transcriptional regulator n=1 Tax=Halosimplex halophilum TaxID=2559572 RepID=UPI00107F53FA|nr:helix-turn-helix domain-containing protein [Halosimplex halophilum]
MASLRDLGLSEYEARAYRALLESGPTTAKELSRASDVPMGRIYDVLNSLETQSLARSQTASRPKKYVAVESDTALDRLLDSKKRELERQAEQYEDIVDDLTDELDGAEPVEEPFWTASVGAAEALDLLVERLTAADERIVVVASAPVQQFDIDDVAARVTAALEDALERGVSVSVLLTPEMVDALPEAVGERYREALQPHANFETRTSANVTGTFEIVDDTEVCIEVPHPLTEDETLAVIDLKDPEFAADIAAEFGPRWEEARELRL